MLSSESIIGCGLVILVIASQPWLPDGGHSRLNHWWSSAEGSTGLIRLAVRLPPSWPWGCCSCYFGIEHLYRGFATVSRAKSGPARHLNVTPKPFSAGTDFKARFEERTFYRYKTCGREMIQVYGNRTCVINWRDFFSPFRNHSITSTVCGPRPALSSQIWLAPSKNMRAPD